MSPRKLKNHHSSKLPFQLCLCKSTHRWRGTAVLFSSFDRDQHLRKAALLRCSPHIAATVPYFFSCQAKACLLLWFFQVLLCIKVISELKNIKADVCLQVVAGVTGITQILHVVRTVQQLCSNISQECSSAAAMDCTTSRSCHVYHLDQCPYKTESPN